MKSVFCLHWSLTLIVKRFKPGICNYIHCRGVWLSLIGFNATWFLLNMNTVCWLHYHNLTVSSLMFESLKHINNCHICNLIMKALLHLFKWDLEWLNWMFILVLWCKQRLPNTGLIRYALDTILQAVSKAILVVGILISLFCKDLFLLIWQPHMVGFMLTGCLSCHIQLFPICGN